MKKKIFLVFNAILQLKVIQGTNETIRFNSTPQNAHNNFDATCPCDENFN